jgi:hypothetical protein
MEQSQRGPQRDLGSSAICFDSERLCAVNERWIICWTSAMWNETDLSIGINWFSWDLLRWWAIHFVILDCTRWKWHRTRFGGEKMERFINKRLWKWMMNDGWWIMNHEWWMMDDGWWMMDDGWQRIQ